VIYTHHHFDHIAGFDDLRAFNYTSRSPVPLYVMSETLAHLKHVFNYAFDHDEENLSSFPVVHISEIDESPFVVAGMEVIPIPLLHGSMRVNGYRIGPAAYCTDCNAIPEESYARLRGLDLLILDALRLTPHPTHFSVNQAVDVARRIGARRTYFTHIAHDVLHMSVEAELPEGIFLGYDGLTLDVAG